MTNVEKYKLIIQEISTNHPEFKEYPLIPYTSMEKYDAAMCRFRDLFDHYRIKVEEDLTLKKLKRINRWLNFALIFGAAWAVAGIILMFL